MLVNEQVFFVVSIFRNSNRGSFRHFLACVDMLQPDVYNLYKLCNRIDCHNWMIINYNSQVMYLSLIFSLFQSVLGVVYLVGYRSLKQKCITWHSDLYTYKILQVCNL